MFQIFCINVQIVHGLMNLTLINAAMGKMSWRGVKNVNAMCV